MWTLLTDAAPVILQLVSMALAYFGAEQSTLASFQALVEASKDEGLISETTRAVFLAQIAALQNAQVDPAHLKLVESWRALFLPAQPAQRAQVALAPPQPIGVGLTPATGRPVAPVVERVPVHLTVSDQPFPPPVQTPTKF